MRNKLIYILLIILTLLFSCNSSGNKTKQDMVFITGGSFQMGDTFNDGDADIDEVPVHTVSVNSFIMSKYEVTQKEFESYMNYNPSDFKGHNLPVTNLDWLEVMKFCNKKSESEGLTPCYKIDGWDNTICNFESDGYRLPTEAEWEYAAKGGEKGSIYKYAGSNDVESVAWYQKNSNGTTHNVGTKKPNELGIYDMNGNVSEWCWDAYKIDYYKNSPSDNPHGPAFKGKPVRRGGSWINNRWNVRTTTRLTWWASSKSPFLGFRIVRSMK